MTRQAAGLGTMKKFNFTSGSKPGFMNVKYDAADGPPLFNESAGYGFVGETGTFPPRKVHTAAIVSDGTGFYISEPAFEEEKKFEQDHYNRFGMAFRIGLPPGAYHIAVKTATDSGDTSVAVSGMHPDRLLAGGCWDAAGLIPVKTQAVWQTDREWRYSYASGRDYIDIEIEPKKRGVPVGLESIVIEPIISVDRREGELPAVYLLGDSTVKSYTFDEAPMSGWGQVIHRLFDERKVRVLNYSMGGRSFKNAYWEGRLNDILLSGRAGDYILIQFGHNDESLDEFRRFGRGSTEQTYEAYIRDIYVPAIRARGMIPIFVTPMSRVNGAAALGSTYENSFKNRKFPAIMARLGAELGITVLDLNAESLNYYNEIGVEATTAVFMSIEAGETPGKTNDGTYANGHPAGKIDGTHYKEALSKQFARIVVTLLAEKGSAGDSVAGGLASCLKTEVREAIKSGDWSFVFPEIPSDTTRGAGAYYRNQIEKLIQLGCMHKDEYGRFNPERVITVEEFISGLCAITQLEPVMFGGYPAGPLTRQTMGAMIGDAYHAKFKERPKYMTDYNGKAVRPGDPHYDPNLDTGAGALTYYPLVPFDRLEDAGKPNPEWAAKVKDAYELGLIRSEHGIARGRLANGTRLEPKAEVTRAKAAKALYFMWVLVNPVKAENHAVPR